MDSHEESAGQSIVELLTGQDVGPELHQIAGHRVHQARTVLTGQGEDELATGGGTGRHEDLRCVAFNATHIAMRNNSMFVEGGSVKTPADAAARSGGLAACS